MSRLRIYISGPMTGLPEYNHPNFDRVAAYYRANGFAAVNPAELAGPDVLDWDEYMRQDIRWMMDCDCIALLDGWENSKGARIELFNAVSLKWPIFTEDGEVYDDYETIRRAFIRLVEDGDFLPYDHKRTGTTS